MKTKLITILFLTGILFLCLISMILSIIIVAIDRHTWKNLYFLCHLLLQILYYVIFILIVVLGLTLFLKDELMLPHNKWRM